MESKRTFKVNSQLLPQGFPREFDAHIYFSENTQSEAEQLRALALEKFKGRLFFVGEMIPEPIGPHLLPMFEMNFPKDLFADVVLWLMSHRGSLSVLVHELTGDDLNDHTDAALWLGSPVALDLSRFTSKN